MPETLGTWHFVGGGENECGPSAEELWSLRETDSPARLTESSAHGGERAGKGTSMEDKRWYFLGLAEGGRASQGRDV